MVYRVFLHHGFFNVLSFNNLTCSRLPSFPDQYLINDTEDTAFYRQSTTFKCFHFRFKKRDVWGRGEEEGGEAEEGPRKPGTGTVMLIH